MMRRVVLRYLSLFSLILPTLLIAGGVEPVKKPTCNSPAAPIPFGNFPVPGNPGTPVDQDIEISFSQAVETAPEGSNTFVSIYKTSDMSLVEQIDPRNYLMLDGGTRIVLKHNYWEFNTEYSITVDMGAFVSQTLPSEDCVPIDYGAWTFTTVNDVDAPSINHTNPAATQDLGFVTADYAFTAIDESPFTVHMFYRHISDPDFVEHGVSIDLPGSQFSQNDKFTIDQGFFDAMGMEYYFVATDLAGNSSRDPMGTETYLTNYKYKNKTAEIPITLVGFGGETRNWRIITVPFAPNDQSITIASVLDEVVNLQNENKTEWRLIRYLAANGRDNWIDYPDFTTFEIGQGYFINIKQPLEKIDVGTDLIPPSWMKRSSLFTMSLRPGWNQIGNPYLMPIDWADVVDLNSLSGTLANLKTYGISGTTGAYLNASTLQPYEGGFVFSGLTSDIQIKIPFQGQVVEEGGRVRGSGGRISKIEGSDLSQSEWVSKFRLSQGEIVSDIGGIGMHPEALSSFDDFDDVNPPKMFDYAEVNFDHPEFFYKKLALDVVPTQDEYTWDFRVDSNVEGISKLSWDNNKYGANEKDLYLLDVALQVLINMREVSEHSFSTKESSKFKVYFGSDLENSIKPEQVFLSKPYPNPMLDGANINYTIPELENNYYVKLEVFDAMGKRIALLDERVQEPGFYSAKWIPEEIASGLYICRLIVEGQLLKKVCQRKIVLKN